MKATRPLLTLAVLGLSTACALPAAAVVIDGVADVDYGPAISVQTTQTQFGNSGLGLPDFANGS